MWATREGIIECRHEAPSLIEHLPGIEEFEVFDVFGTANGPIDHGGQIVEVALEVLQVFLPCVASVDLEDSYLHVYVLEHLGVLTDLKSTKLVYHIVTHGFLVMAVEGRESGSQLLLALDLRVVEAAVENDGDFMRGGGLRAPLEVSLEELNALLVIQEASVFIELVHVCTQLDQDVNLARLREKVEARASQVDDSSKRL